MAAPVYVYFELSKFYQNHRTYVKSRSNGQLAGGVSLWIARILAHVSSLTRWGGIGVAMNGAMCLTSPNFPETRLPPRKM